MGWSIALSGTGLSGEAKVEASVAAGFTANAGEAKLVFLPVAVTAEKLRITQGGKQSVRIDLSEMQRSEDVAPGVLLLTSDARPAIGVLEQTYPLAGDPTGTPATYTWAQTSRARRRVSASGSRPTEPTSGSNAARPWSRRSSSRSSSPAGGTDELHRPAEGDGVLWAP